MFYSFEKIPNSYFNFSTWIQFFQQRFCIFCYIFVGFISHGMNWKFLVSNCIYHCNKEFTSANSRI